MRTILATRYVDIPENVKLSIKSRVVTVTGPRGTLVREFKHLNLDIRPVGKTRLRVDLWFGNKKELACIRTVCSHIENMCTGVTQGYCYKLRFAYAHFPINVSVVKDKLVEVRNFLGEKRVRRVAMLGDTTVMRSAEVKDQLEIYGNDIELVSRSAAMVHQSCLVRNKDIRKFLDGIYVSEKGAIKTETD